MTQERPNIIILAGPNGAGKTTCALKVLPREFQIQHFVNADLIAQGLSPLDPALSEIDAGRLMLKRISDLAARWQSFSFETTLSSKYFLKFLKERKAEGYDCHIFYVWLSCPELAISRVAARVAAGGHSVPEDVVRRRYERSIWNFVHVYAPVADSWLLCDNSNVELELIAEGKEGGVVVFNEALYSTILGRTREHG